MAIFLKLSMAWLKNELKLGCGKKPGDRVILSRAAFSGVMNLAWLVLLHGMSICYAMRRSWGGKLHFTRCDPFCNLFEMLFLLARHVFLFYQQPYLTMHYTPSIFFIRQICWVIKTFFVVYITLINIPDSYWSFLDFD
jgi:hypothetical protein